MRQPRKGITNVIKAMMPRIVPPITVPVSTEEVVSPVIKRHTMFLGFRKHILENQYYIAHGQANTEV